MQVWQVPIFSFAKNANREFFVPGSLVLPEKSIIFEYRTLYKSLGFRSSEFPFVK
jgi:hypothetical protein